MTIVPTLCQVVNLSLSTGCFPSVLSKAIVTPILKKPTLDCQQLKNYRPVSNLPFLGKLIERVVSSQVATYVGSNSLGEPLQSAYRRVHSTETALRAIDDRKAVFLVMIDMSAAFDTVDHGILLQRLSDDFGLCGPVHRWFQSYLRNRTSQVCVSGSFSTETQLKYGVPQGSVIGPQVFTYYSHTIGQIICKHSIQYHIYADDVQFSWPLTQTSLVIQLAHCSNWSVVWRSCRHGWLLTSWWWTLIKQSSSSHLLLLTISTLNISPSSLMMLKSKALLLLKTSVLFLILIWRWAITLTNFLAPWTSKSGTLTESDGSWISIPAIMLSVPSSCPS